MQINDELFDTKKQKRSENLHMFQRNEPIVELNFDIEKQILESISKVKKKYRSYKNDKDLEIKTNSLVSCAKGLIEIHNVHITQSINDYLNEQKTKNVIEAVKEVIHHPIIDVYEIEEKITFDDQEEMISSTEENINISELIKATEKELMNTGNQKDVLMSLINDINSNNDNNIYYDETKFANNINEIIKETQDELLQEDGFFIESSQPIVFNSQDVKKSKFSLFLVFFMIILLGVACYVNRELILQYLKEFGILK